MRSQISIEFIFVSFIFFTSCAGPGLDVAPDNISHSAKSEENNVDIIWESVPRPIAKGNDGQLLVRTSESMNLLYAAHNEKGKQNLFMAKTKNIGDSFSGAVPVNLEKGEVSAHGENGPKLRSGKGRGMFAAWVGDRKSVV